MKFYSQSRPNLEAYACDRCDRVGNIDVIMGVRMSGFGPRHGVGDEGGIDLCIPCYESLSDWWISTSNEFQTRSDNIEAALRLKRRCENFLEMERKYGQEKEAQTQAAT